MPSLAVIVAVHWPNGAYSIVVQNNGGTVTGPTTVTDTLPAGLSFVSGTGTGWSCGATGQAVNAEYAQVFLIIAALAQALNAVKVRPEDRPQG